LISVFHPPNQKRDMSGAAAAHATAEASQAFTAPEFIIVMPIEPGKPTRHYRTHRTPPFDPENLDSWYFPLKDDVRAAIKAWLEENGGITPELKESFRKFLALGYGFSHSGKSTLFQYGLDWVLMGIAEAIGETLAFFPEGGVIMDQERSVKHSQTDETRALYPGTFTIAMNTLFTDVGRHPDGGPPPRIDTACGHAAVKNALATIPGLLILVKGAMWDGDGDFNKLFKELRPSRNGNMDDSKFLPQDDGKPSFMQQMYGSPAYNSTMCPFPKGCSQGEVEIPKSVVPYAPNFMSPRQYPQEICQAYKTSGYCPAVVKAILEKAFTKVLEEESTPRKLEEIKAWMMDQETHIHEAPDKSVAFLFFLAAFGQPLDLPSLLDRMHRFTVERTGPFTSTKELVIGMKEFLGGWSGDINIPFEWFEEGTVALTKARGDPEGGEAPH